MSRHEKQAWFNLAVVGLAIVSFLALLPFVGPHRATAAFGVLGLLGLSPAFLAVKRKAAEVVADERDVLIQSGTWVIGYSVFWVVFVGGTMAMWALFRQQGCVPVNLLPLFPFVGWMVLTLVQSTATVIQYGRGR